tara:strand:+ start:666 stop:1370 length:705 start_codon:yes stop_codon:yes gene_type:complete
MINENKWISSINKSKLENNNVANHIDNQRWTSTIPNKKKYNSIKKYSLTGILFIFGLIFVSIIKEETRNLQKEINELQASIGSFKFNLNQAIIDNEVITSPENIARLAKENLNIDLVFYKRYQIKKLHEENKIVTNLQKVDVKKNSGKNISKTLKLKVNKKITEVKKLQELYRNPKLIPKKIKTQVVKKIDKKKLAIRDIYRSPKEVLTLERAQRWGVVQVVKLFLGIPVFPGR